MGITVTEDEDDKKARQAKEVAADISRRHARDGSSGAGEELKARSLFWDRAGIKNPDPRKRYRLVNRTKDGEYIGMRQGEGYDLTPHDSKTQLNGRARNNKEAQVMGDLVLMETPAENYEERRAMRRERFNQMYGTRRKEEAAERINKIARDGGLVGPHKNAVVE